MPVFADRVTHGHHLHVEGASSQAPDGCLTVGLVNNMPDSALVSTERQIHELLKEAAGERPVRLLFYALPTVKRTDWGRDYMSRTYSFAETLADGAVDGLIVTGAEPQTPDLVDEAYWPELGRVIDWAKGNTSSTIWSCLAVHASVRHLDGIERRPLAQKCIGIFEQEKRQAHPMLDGTPDRLLMPHSRWNEIRQGDLEAHGYSVLTRSGTAGVDTFVKQQSRSLFVFLQGHPEYEALSLLGEYRRDAGRFLRGEAEAYPTMPNGYFDEAGERLALEYREQALADRRQETLAKFPAERLAGHVTHRWRDGAVGLYRNWLAFLSARSGRTGD
ncbi:MAG TPA: homoserine O-succinyltransferase [Reyranella sp.]|nr:homoserine O-succinyltransferase [Reyranella sp.]